MVVLIIVIALILAARYIYQLSCKDKLLNFKDFYKAVALLSKISYQKGYIDSNTVSDDKLANPVMFSFNPNNLTAAQWQQLGLIR